MLQVRRLFLGIGFIVLLAMPAQAAEKAAIKRSVDAGVKALLALQRPDGTFPYQEMGATSLAAIALLECEVPKDDPSIKAAATAIRRASLSMTHTYSLALSILFLDLLDDEQDVPLIESMVVRLLAGQNASGGWTYQCPALPAGEMDRLSTSLRTYKATEAKPEKRPREDRQREPREASPEIKKQIAELGNRVANPALDQSFSDNSNTQFALLALWVGRRYGLPVDGALTLVEKRFRESQNADGGWSYQPYPSQIRAFNSASTLTMTCAGLLGLGVGQGVRATPKPQSTKKPKAENAKGKKADEEPQDKALEAGLIVLGSAIGKPLHNDPKSKQAITAPLVSGRSYYFLWSLERVAVAYDLERIGNKDWYAWGCDVLVLAQRADGTWVGSHTACADTSFALLFLRKSNLASDLTTYLRGRVKDPSRTSLKSTGSAKEPIKLANEDTESNSPSVAKSLDPKPGDALDAGTPSLVRDLVEGSGAKKQQALDQFRKGRGSSYTRDLASAIEKLDGEDRKKAREVLADRLSEMTAATLGEKLKEDNAEIRRAAALACAMKEEKVHVSRLIEMLEDSDQSVRRAAHASIKSLTGQDFGPAKNATEEEIFTSKKAWQAWWKKQNDK